MNDLITFSFLVANKHRFYDALCFYLSSEGTPEHTFTCLTLKRQVRLVCIISSVFCGIHQHMHCENRDLHFRHICVFHIVVTVTGFSRVWKSNFRWSKGVSHLLYWICSNQTAIHLCRCEHSNHTWCRTTQLHSCPLEAVVSVQSSDLTMIQPNDQVDAAGLS